MGNNLIVEITNENFDSVIADNEKVTMVDFWAEWCGPCVMLAPVLEQLSVEASDKVTVAKCDVDKNPALSQKFGIRNIPSVLFFKNGKLLDRQVGLASKSIYLEKIKNM